MTKTKQVELKITNQVLATLVVFLALGLGYMISKEQGWVKKNIEIPQSSQRTYTSESIVLPSINSNSSIVTKAISSRRTRSDFADLPLLQDQLHTILWSMQGITADWGGRVVPTAKSSYPLQITVVVQNIEGLEKGIYQFDSSSSAILQTHHEIPEEFSNQVEALTSIYTAPAIFIISGDKAVQTEKLQAEKPELMYLEAGHATQNAFLVAESMKLGLHTTIKYDNDFIKNALKLPSQEIVLSMFSVGKPKEW